MVERIALTQSPRWRLSFSELGLGVGIGHTHEDARGAPQEVGEGLDEADGGAGCPTS